MKKTIYSTIMVLLAGIFWGSIGLFVRNLNTLGFAAMELCAVRSIIALIMLGIGIFLYNRDLLRIRLKDLWCFVGTGIVSLTFFNICYFTTIERTSLSVAAILLYTAPAMVMVMSAFLFREKFNAKKGAAILLAFVGCVFVTGVLSEGASLDPIGILIGLCSGFGYALYSIFGRFAIQRGYHSLTITFYTFLLSGVACLFFIKPQHLMTAVQETPVVIPLMIGFAFVGSVLPYILYTLGLTGMESGRASIIASVEPVVATIIGFIIFHESLTFLGILGVILVLGSIVLVNTNHGNA